MRPSLSIVALVLTVASGPSVLPDSDPQIQILRRLHQQVLAVTEPRLRVRRVNMQLDALKASEGIADRRLPPSSATGFTISVSSAPRCSRRRYPRKQVIVGPETSKLNCSQSRGESHHEIDRDY